MTSLTCCWRHAHYPPNFSFVVDVLALHVEHLLPHELAVAIHRNLVELSDVDANADDGGKNNVTPIDRRSCWQSNELNSCATNSQLNRLLKDGSNDERCGAHSNLSKLHAQA